MTRTNGGRTVAVALLGLAVLAAGCMQDRYSRDRGERDDDPILGLPARIPPKERSVSSPYPSAPNRTTNADLASRNTGWSSEATGDLRIGPSPGPGPSPRDADVRPASGARLQDPVGASTSTTDRSDAPLSSGNVRLNSFEHAQMLLARYGVRWQRLETTDANDGKFSCSIPSASNPNKARTYEATDKYGLFAMQKVLDQIAREQR